MTKIQDLQKQNESLKQKADETERKYKELLKSNSGDNDEEDEEGNHKNIKPQKNKGLDEDVDDNDD